VPTSVNPDELCLNGMSFSKRQSKWANSALVVNVTLADFASMGVTEDGVYAPLQGVEWQRSIERAAALLGGGNLVAPVQRVTDFIDGKLGSSEDIPSSSYRMGVKLARCDLIYPEFVTEALRKSLLQFDRRMPGFITSEALLHGVETRTSAPVQISRSPETLESVSLAGLVS